MGEGWRFVLLAISCSLTGRDVTQQLLVAPEPARSNPIILKDHYKLSSAGFLTKVNLLYSVPLSKFRLVVMVTTELSRRRWLTTEDTETGSEKSFYSPLLYTRRPWLRVGAGLDTTFLSQRREQLPPAVLLEAVGLMEGGVADVYK